ncbi:uncharacterized protein SPSC_04333 [Sporisorium scitamineum]|uniref:Chromo domain-containing protein n=1 Tax=Sporisorium scitamineum TaxID=49012 RepID=A0A127Z3Y6_9BASI|nr:uncharacterized protein SPSC_04333 [Sporisorium scitamineum]
MPVTPRGRSRTASTSASPVKSNGRKQLAPIALDISDEEDEEVVEKKPAKKGHPSKGKKELEVVDDEDDDSVQAEDEFEVEAVRSHRPLKGTESWNMEYLIKWKGWPESDNTWEPETNLPRGMVDEYWKTQPSKSQPKKFEQVQKRKSRHEDEEEVEEVEESEEEDDSKPSSRGKAENGHRASAASSKNNSPAKKPRISAASRRRASSSSTDEDDDDDEDDDADARPKADNKQRALEKVRVRFLDHYMERQKDWEKCVECIVNMQRSEDDSRLQSWVQFEQSKSWSRAMDSINMPEEADGRGPRLWVDNDIANERCPQKVIKFYEQHVRFSNPRLAR